jgi:trehalose 6-phosphate synthase/phosphatase
VPTRLLIVANRLPVTLTGDTVKKSSGGLVAALEGVGKEDYDVRWVGWPGGDVPAERQDAVRQQLGEQAQATPVFLSAREVAGYYHGFSNASLWPLLHDLPTRFAFDGGWWETYQAVNRRFADVVLDVVGDEADALVWVHDYQLMLLPTILRERRPSLRIGFFLHTPFPPYETFRYLPRRAEVVAGLLGADLIGFHTFGYLRHYRDCVLRLLGHETDVTRIRADDRTRSLAAYPIGINAAKADAELKRPEFRAERERLAHAHGGKRLVVSVERLDYTKGILRRLDAIDHYLDTAGDAEDVKFIFVSVPSREEVDEYRQLKADVESAVGRINGKHATASHSPIHFVYGSVNYTELMALYSLAAVALVTPLIDGMNLVAKEYVAAQDVSEAGSPGVLVLSEFAGAAEELFNATIVNPYDVDAVAAAIRDALAVLPPEARRRMAPMRQRVMAFDAARWAKAFVDDLRAADPRADQPTGDPAVAQRQLREAIEAGKRVALFLDYDGTLRELERDPAASVPGPDLLDLLRRLERVKGLDVTIISGRRAEELDGFVGGFPFALVAEHGADFRPAGAVDWERMDLDVSYAWKEQIRPVLDLFEASTPGSFIEDKRTSLVWHYRRADPEFGSWKANQLAAELAAVAANEPVTVRHGKKIVEATAAEVNKGAAVDRLIHGKGYDLVLCAGDDTTDENMFRLAVDGMITIHVGGGETRAAYRVADPAAFRALLRGALPGGERTV